MRARKLGMALLGLVAAGAMIFGAASPASASTSDPVLTAYDSSSNMSCDYTVNVAWTRATQHLTGTVNLYNSQLFSGCSKYLGLTFVMVSGTTVVPLTEIRIGLVTACGITDPTCGSSSTTHIDTYTTFDPYLVPIIDHVNFGIGNR